MTTDLAEKLEQDYHILPYEDAGSELKNSHRTHIINPPGNLHIWTPGMSNHGPVAIRKVHLQCAREAPHMSHEWYFYYDSTGPRIALCTGEDELEADGGQAISSSD